jgi:small multidrug resistance pump
MVVAYLLLAVAIISEVIGTLSLKLSDGFTKLVPTIFVIVGYLGAFAALGLGLSKGLPMGVAYGIWAGCGTALVAILGIFLFKETLNVWGFLGLALIIVGVVLLEMGSSHR